MKKCLFCQIIEKKVPSYAVYEDKNTLAILDAFPVENGHVLIIPKECKKNLLELSESSAIEVLKTQRLVTANLLKKLKPKGFNFINNFNEIAGQKINHYHLHVIPKYQQNYGLEFKNHQPLNKKTVEEIWKEIKK